MNAPQEAGNLGKLYFLFAFPAFGLFSVQLPLNSGLFALRSTMSLFAIT